MNKALDILVSFGAAVVIFGAWAKLLHRPYADFMLTCGLLTEAAIFISYGVLAIVGKNKPDISADSASDNSQLTSAIDSLNTTIKNIFKHS